MEPEIAPKLSLTPVSTYLHQTVPTMRLSRFDIGLVIWQQETTQTRFMNRTTPCCVKQLGNALVKVSLPTVYWASLSSSSSRVLADKCYVARGHCPAAKTSWVRGGVPGPATCDIWPLWSRGAGNAIWLRRGQKREKGHDGVAGFCQYAADSVVVSAASSGGHAQQTR